MGDTNKLKSALRVCFQVLLTTRMDRRTHGQSVFLFPSLCSVTSDKKSHSTESSNYYANHVRICGKVYWFNKSSDGFLNYLVKEKWEQSAQNSVWASGQWNVNTWTSEMSNPILVSSHDVYISTPELDACWILIFHQTFISLKSTTVSFLCIFHTMKYQLILFWIFIDPPNASVRCCFN